MTLLTAAAGPSPRRPALSRTVWPTAAAFPPPTVGSVRSAVSPTRWDVRTATWRRLRWPRCPRPASAVVEAGRHPRPHRQMRRRPCPSIPSTRDAVLLTMTGMSVVMPLFLLDEIFGKDMDLASVFEKTGTGTLNDIPVLILIKMYPCRK
jgi:hypothetical protein